MPTVEDMLEAKKNGVDAEESEEVDEEEADESEDVEGEEASESESDESSESDDSKEDAADDDSEDGESAEGDRHAEGEDEPSKFDALLEKLEERLKPVETKPAAVAEKVWNDEDWNRFTEETGLSKAAGMRLNNAIAIGLQRMEAKIMGQFSGFQQEQAIKSLSSKYKDIETYRKGITEIMNRFPAGSRANPDLIELAYAKTKLAGQPKVIKKIQAGKERDRKVIRTAGNRNGSGSGNGKGASLKMSTTERQAYESFGKASGMSENEYVQELRRNKSR